MIGYRPNTLITATAGPTVSSADSDKEASAVPERLRSMSVLEPGQSVVPESLRSTSQPGMPAEDEQSDDATAFRSR